MHRELAETSDPRPIISRIVSDLHSEGPVDPKKLEYLAIAKEFHPKYFREYEKRITYFLGLFYKIGEPSTLVEKVYREIAILIQSSLGESLTPVQASAINKINDNRFFSFSAPTSAGKSYIFRHLIQNCKEDIIIVLPSRALIAEYVAEIKKSVDVDALVLEFPDDVNRKYAKRRIFVLTPERTNILFKIISRLKIGLVLLDEAQLSEEEPRGFVFDAFVRRIIKRCKEAKIIFAHPFIENPEAQLQKHGLTENSGHQSYAQSPVGKIFLVKSEKKYQYFSPANYSERETYRDFQGDLLLESISNDKTLMVYISKAKIYSKKFIDEFGGIISACEVVRNSEALDIIEKLKDYIGATPGIKSLQYSSFISLLERGIVIHHGSIPLNCRYLIEQFIRIGCCRICFATSTLLQGINMPFDVVLIDNFRFQGPESKKNLDLKNLIGRAGRSRADLKDTFDYGYVIVKSENAKTFSQRYYGNSSLNNTSILEKDTSLIHDDQKDLVEAVVNDDFDDDLQITRTQVDRILAANLDPSITFVLDNLFTDINGIERVNSRKLSKSIRDGIKRALKTIYVSHLRRAQINKAEENILDMALRILLWRIDGYSFKEIVSMRVAYITNQEAQREIESSLRRGLLSKSQATGQIRAVKLKFSQPAAPLPNISAKVHSIFPEKSSINDFQFDIVVYDTYDYLDKVIGLSLSDPLSAAFELHYMKTRDERAELLIQLIRYGTTNEKHIMLQRYGFGSEDFEWLDQIVDSLNEEEIVFNQNVSSIDSSKRKLISPFIPKE